MSALTEAATRLRTRVDAEPGRMWAPREIAKDHALAALLEAIDEQHHPVRPYGAFDHTEDCSHRAWSPWPCTDPVYVAALHLAHTHGGT